jgi:small ligand-binding sensory domain FIST
MQADRHDLIDGAAQSCADALSHLEGLAPLGAIAFDCAGRRAGLLDGGLDEELAVMRKGLRDAPFAGFYTTGEIARVRGASGMHALTLVTLALA